MAFHFPSQAAIVSYLEQYSSEDRYLKENGVFKAVAQYFADQSFDGMGVQMGVTLTMCDLGKKIGLPGYAVITIIKNLTEALKDCANGKRIEIEKKTNL